MTLFSVPFRSPMGDSDLGRLGAALDLVIYSTPKPGVSGASFGLARLDHWSGLFLAHGGGDDEWLLEGRTWGNPAEGSVHEWHVSAALAARELDPTVEIPSRRPAPPTEIKPRPLGHAANKRLARLGRRLLGLE